MLFIMQDGWTAIIWATSTAKFDILKLLIDSGGDINFRNNVSDLLVVILSVAPLTVLLLLF
jgi:ankyrin repeat protein